MQIAVTTILALASVTVPQIQASSLKSLTSERHVTTRDSHFRPLATHSHSRLIHASFPTYPRPRIRLEFERASDRPCELDFPTMDEVERPLQFDALGNGKLLLSFAASDDPEYRYLLSLVVNASACEFVAVTTKLLSDASGAVVLLVGEDAFDVFLEAHAHCRDDAACRLRYSDAGQLIGATDFEVDEEADEWSIDTVAERSFVDGYFYSVTRRNVTLVQRMDQDLKVLKDLTISKPFLYSASHGSVNDCRGLTSSHLACELRDSEFETRSRVTIDTEYFKSYMRAVRLFNLSDGSAMILYVLQVYVEESVADQFTTYLQHVDRHGHAANPVKFQEDVCKDFKDIDVIRVDDDFYCFNVYCRDGIFTKCAEVGEM